MNRSRPLFAGLLIAGVLVSGGSQAAYIRTFSFEVTFYPTPYRTGAPVPDEVMQWLGGQTFTGQFSYDMDTPEDPREPGHYGALVDINMSGLISHKGDGSAIAITDRAGGGPIPPLDQFTLVSALQGVPLAGYAASYIEMRFRDDTATAFDSTALPETFTDADFPERLALFTFKGQTIQQGMTWYALVGAVAPVPAGVSVPPSIALAVVGMAALALRRPPLGSGRRQR